MPSDSSLKAVFTKARKLLTNEIVPAWESIVQDVANQRGQLALLSSVAAGLYEELDKLCKKAPAEQVTNLALTQVNDLIKEVRELCSTDAFISRTKEFVPAGDNPEHRDVVMVLRQLLQGLERFKTALEASAPRKKAGLGEAEGLLLALEMANASWELTEITADALKREGCSLPDYWLTDNPLRRVRLELLVDITLEDRLKPQ